MLDKKIIKSRFNVIIFITLLISIILNIFLLQQLNYSEFNVNKNGLDKNGQLWVKREQIL